MLRPLFRLILALLCATLPALPASAAREATWVSYPALSPDGATLYFTAWGDVWSAPVDGGYLAVRLTDNVAYDGRPTVSPDGATLAFLSDRFGNYDIFTMPADGGDVQRLTYDSGTDYVYGWRPDGTAVLEYGTRQDQWGMSLYELPLDGTAPRRLSGPDHDDHLFGSYLGPRVNHLVYARGPGDWARKNHRGSDTYDLWRFDVQTGQHTPLTDAPGKDAWPQSSPDGNLVYFVSDRSGSENIWVMDMQAGTQTQLTQFSGDGPRWPRISASGNRLAFTVMGEPYVMDLPGGQPRKVRITFSGEPKTAMRLSQDKRGELSEYSVSPNGKYFAFVVLGDVYVLKNPDSYKPEEKPDQDLSRAFRLTATAGREWQLSWSPKSTKLAYISDRDGQYDVYSVDLATRLEERLTSTPEDEWIPQFAPHGDKLAWYSGNRRLMLHDVATKQTTQLAEGRLRNGPYNLGFEWSPDGKWISYSASVLDYLPDVFIINIDEKKPVNVSQTPDWDSGGTWSRDGKYLAWSHEMEDGAEVMLLELNPKEQRFDTDILFPDDVPTPEPKTDESEPTAPKADDETPKPADKPAAEGEDAKKEEKKDEPTPVQVDLERIHLRGRSITTMQGNAYGPQFDPNSKFVLFTSEHSGETQYWTVTIEDEQYAQVAPGENREQPQFNPDGGKLYFLSGGNIAFMNMNGAGAGSGGGQVGTVARVDFDQYAMWDQMLLEGWRSLRDGFYDPNMNNVDWAAVLARYRPRVQELGTYDEFSQLMREMLGELNASHLGFFGGPTNNQASDVTADFGVVYDETHTGAGWKVAKVINDGPADKPGSRLYPRDVIQAINGAPVTTSTDRARLLNNLHGQPVVLIVQTGAEAAADLKVQTTEEKAADKATGTVKLSEGQRRVVINPVPQEALGQLHYEQWVEDNRAKVYAATGGKVGYQHIQGMNNPSLEKFRRELFTESRGKQALIIDVRFNGGGNIHEQLVDLLDRRPFAIGQYRDDAKYTQPALRWEGPIVVLINASSFSDAEIFPHIMQRLGLATIIGEPTGGNVIGTYNFQLMDGSTFRMPNRGWWLLDDVNMEGFGAQPDIYVHIDPMVTARGGDNQLDAAVEYLQGKLAQP
jgi:tricorn protease